MSDPSPTASNGRGPNGQFGPGNRFAKGNPHAQAAAKLRAAMMRGVAEDDIETTIKAVVLKARGGDLTAAALLLDRLFGRPATHDLLARVEALEQHLRDEEQ